MSTAAHKSTTAGSPVNFCLLSLAIAALAIGGGVYVAFRGMSLRMFGWLDALGLTGVVERIREMCSGIVPGRFVLYNLPDLLWITAYLLLVNAIIPVRQRASYLFWVLLMPLLGICHEILQGLGVMNGSFDTLDLLCYLIPTVINLIYYFYEKIL